MFSYCDQGSNLKQPISMVKNAHKIVEVKNKNYGLPLMHELLLTFLFRTPFNFKVIRFLNILSSIFGKVSLKTPWILWHIFCGNPVTCNSNILVHDFNNTVPNHHILLRYHNMQKCKTNDEKGSTTLLFNTNILPNIQLIWLPWQPFLSPWHFTMLKYCID